MIDPLAYGPLVHGIARRYRGRGVELADLVGAGWLGVIRAARNHTGPDDTFPAYAAASIRGEIQNEILRYRWIRIHPRSMARYRRGATSDPLAAAAGEADQLRRVRDEDGTDLTASFIADETAETALDQVLVGLSPAEAEVITLRLGLDGSSPRSIGEVVAIVGCDRNRANYLDRRARAKLRRRLEPWVAHAS